MNELETPLAMKTSHVTWILAACLAAATTARAALNIPSDGSDGELVITQNTEIDLGQAVTGQWDANNSANAGKGIYDPEKWAVVFKYSRVTVNAGATVTFKNHPSRAPVVWLVQGHVTINGTVNLNGQGGLPAPGLAEPGPGGFRGGSGYYGYGASDAAGFGIGGGNRDVARSYWAGKPIGGGASYGSVGLSGPATYGNQSLVPLLGGSGGGGAEQNGAGGGAGGGAILIASTAGITITGAIRANGGTGNVYEGSENTGGGSGGGIRLVAEQLAGNGVVEALGGKGPTVNFAGGLGRIRIERVSNMDSLQVTPDPSVVELADGTSPAIWLPDNGPAVRIVSIGAVVAPADPRAGFATQGADVTLPQTATAPVVVETTNVEQASVVKVRTTPRADGKYTETTATVDQVVTEDPLVIRWKANVPVNSGYSTMQVKVVRP